MEEIREDIDESRNNLCGRKNADKKQRIAREKIDVTNS